MRQYKIVAVTALLASLTFGCSILHHDSSTAARQPEPRTPPNTVTSYVTVPQWLQIYGQLSGQTMEVGEGVRECPVTIKVPPYPAMTRSEAVKFMEKIFRKQAGIIVTHPNPNVAFFKLQKPHSVYSPQTNTGPSGAGAPVIPPGPPTK